MTMRCLVRRPAHKHADKWSSSVADGAGVRFRTARVAADLAFQSPEYRRVLAGTEQIILPHVTVRYLARDALAKVNA